MMGQVLQDLGRAIDVTFLHPTAYRPNMNGLVERFNRALKDMLAMFVNQAQSNWSTYLPLVTYAYNSSKQESTGAAPFTYLYGQEAKQPGDLRRLATSAWGRLTESEWNLLRETADKHLEAAQLRMKRLADRHSTRRTTFATGDYVWVLFPAAGRGVAKLKHRWRGPYRIDSDAGFDNYDVTEVSTQRRCLVHCSRLQPYTAPNTALRGCMAQLAGLLDTDTAGDVDVVDELDAVPRRRHRNKSGRYTIQVQDPASKDWHDLSEVRFGSSGKTLVEFPDPGGLLRTSEVAV
jgi:hypothetical protein